jgi:hypothetical protein
VCIRQALKNALADPGQIALKRISFNLIGGKNQIKEDLKILFVHFPRLHYVRIVQIAISWQVPNVKIEITWLKNAEKQIDRILFVRI